MILGAYTTENSLSFDKDLSHVNDQSSSIPQSISFFHPSVNHFEVLFMFTCTSQITRAEDLSFVLNEQMIMRDDPILINKSQFLNFVLMRVVDDSRCSWTIDHQNGVNLSTKSLPYQLLVALLPNRIDASN